MSDGHDTDHDSGRDPDRDTDHDVLEPGGRDYRNRIAMLPGDPPVAYRPHRYLLDEVSHASLTEAGYFDDTGFTSRPVFLSADGPPHVAPVFGQWYLVEGVPDARAEVDRLVERGARAALDIVYFANAGDCCGCPPHPALAGEIIANPWTANPWTANPWTANPWKANPWTANPWTANPWKANAESLNLLATGKPPTSSVLPAPIGARVMRSGHQSSGPNDVVIGVLDSGLAGGWTNNDDQRPELLGLEPDDLQRISGPRDVPSRPMAGRPADNYLDPVAGHGTFIAGIIEQLTPGCTIRVQRVFEPQGDVSVSTLASRLELLMTSIQPAIVSFSFGGTGRDEMFESVIQHYHAEHDVIFVGAAGNEGSCVEQYPAALPCVIGVAGLGPTGPAKWSNYGDWVDACAPGTNLVSSFFANFDGDMPPINGLDADDFSEWATWSGTSFAAPVVVAALARELASGCTPREAVDRVVRAPHLARLPWMGTVVNL